MYEKRIAEFNYKLLNDILNNNVYVSKWNKDVSPFAPFVTLKKTLNIYHMIVRVSNLFGKNWFLSKVYCYLENYCTWILRWSQGKTLVLNNLKACVAYTIYKYKMKCRFHDETMSKKKILYVLKGKLNVQNTVLRKIDYIRKIFIKIFVIICKVCE